MPRPISFVFSSGVLVCLGWGLRGYIGGGPLGAMIPGAFLALWLCILLGIEGRRAAIVTVFGAIGMGFGGEMTYGQTLGLLRGADTLWWGVTGTVVKGGVWGLLAGAMIGFGFAAERLTLRQAAGAFGVFLAATTLGIALIDEPKLIYFSDPVNKPRDECWAGLLFGAAALLWRLHALGAGTLPLRFAAWGFAGGMIGFGGGGVFMIASTRVAEPLRGLPWWKFMEFFFGASLGAAYGACALRHAKALAAPPASAPAPAAPGWGLALPMALFAGVALVGWNYTAEPLLGTAGAWPAQAIAKPIAMVALGYAAWGAVLILASLRWEAVAWQTAIAITFLASVVDLQEDLGAPAALRAGLVLCAAMAAAAGVVRWQRGPHRDLRTLLRALMWACVAVALARLGIELARSPAAWPEARAAGRLLAQLREDLGSAAIVHGIFLACAVWMTAALQRTVRAA